ncbi:hypothetical protein BCR34DRAFT_579491 [Clohesyomyces aquaticus]|uniref:Uncharacterized protein n=1 Tax=Clohesyomyces aquaticus TaxID=1231657 RepID=A0A1Y1YAZ3_9PLEO|nr:hypothetical protein BCR34DRAFT_579491 [Clohesyomyces aquaticus]
MLASPSPSRNKFAQRDIPNTSPNITTANSPSDTISGGILRQSREVTLPAEQNQLDGMDDMARGWRQLFPFTETLVPGHMQGSDFLESWREMYWQEVCNVRDGFGGYRILENQDPKTFAHLSDKVPSFLIERASRREYLCSTISSRTVGKD